MVSGRRPHLAMPKLAAREGRRMSTDLLAAFAFVCGLVAFFTGFVVDLHFLACAVGIVGFVEGLYAQMISETTGQRMFIVVGIIGSFVGMGLGFGHGAFTM